MLRPVLLVFVDVFRVRTVEFRPVVLALVFLVTVPEELIERPVVLVRVEPFNKLLERSVRLLLERRELLFVLTDEPDLVLTSPLFTKPLLLGPFRYKSADLLYLFERW